MIRKLAEELAMDSSPVAGDNNAAPLQEPKAPAVKPSATPAPDYGFTPHSSEGHAQSTHGFLDRSLSGFDQAARDYESTMAEALGSHVKRVSGSSSTSQRAVQRFRNRGQ